MAKEYFVETAWSRTKQRLPSDIKAVLCVPILSPENETIAIIELTRSANLSNYSREDVQIVVAIAAWMGTGIFQNQLRLTLLSQQQLNSRLLEFINLYFSDTYVSDIKILSDIMAYAKQMLQGDKCSFYLIDPSSPDLAADWYIPSDTPNTPIFTKKARLKLQKMRNVPAFVARTGQSVNIRDVIEDNRFRDQDKNSSEITRTALCSPIMDRDIIAGVILLTNKKDNGYFTTMDEDSFKIFANYCVLSLHHYKVKKALRDKKNYLIINQEILEHQMMPCIHDLSAEPETRIKLPREMIEFNYYPHPEIASDINGYLNIMFQSVCGEVVANDPNLDKFFLCVQKSYRNPCYRDFKHAFVVAHAMYNILLRNKSMFTDGEKDALMVAALTHDIDHRGQDNNYYELTKHPAAELYRSSSILETHHATMAKLVIKMCGMFKSLSEYEYKSYIDEIEMLILHTDLELHMRCRHRLEHILAREGFNWEDQEHRFLAKGMMMICAAEINRNKPLPVNEKLVVAEHMELIKQSEENRKRNFSPIVLSKDLSYSIALDEVLYLENVVIPANRLLVQLLPPAKDLLKCSLDLHNSWKELLEISDKRLWRPEESMWQCDRTVNISKIL